MLAETVLIDDETALLESISEQSNHKRISFDTEGVELGCIGELTVATFYGLDSEDSPNYVVDVQLLSGERVFAYDRPSYRNILDYKSYFRLSFW